MFEKMNTFSFLSILGIYLNNSTDLKVMNVTTRTPTVTDVFVSGRNVGALRLAQRVGFQSLAPGLADNICRGHNFVMRVSPLISNLRPYSK